VNIYIAHYHFEEISSALNALSVHLKQKWFKKIQPDGRRLSWQFCTWRSGAQNEA